MPINDLTAFANREVCDLVFQDYSTGKVFMTLDYANSTATELTGEAVYAYGGKGHPIKVTFVGDRGGTLTIETQMQTMKLYSLMSGAEIEKTASWLKHEEITCETAGEIVLSETPTDGSAEVFAVGDEGGTAIEVEISGTTASSESLTQGTTYSVYYMTEISTGVHKINVKSTTIPKAFRVYGDTYSKTEDDVIVEQRMIAYKAQAQPTMSLGFANNGDPATVTLTMDLMADKDNNILDLMTIDPDAA